jgi:hypothetical protein
MPYVCNKKTVPGDPRHGSRWATEGEKALAARALAELEVERLRIALVPAPSPSFAKHKIRVVECRNPEWYRRFVDGRWNRDGCQVKRARVERALGRVAVTGIVRRNGYEASLLKFLLDYEPERVYCHASNQEKGSCRTSTS